MKIFLWVLFSRESHLCLDTGGVELELNDLGKGRMKVQVLMQLTKKDIVMFWLYLAW